MRQEEKAKAYDEALERAKKELEQDLHESGVWAIQRIFPQLKESEDERIRTRLIEYFQGFLKGYEDCYKDGGSVRWEGLDVKSIIAWLEKQKEQKPEKVLYIPKFRTGDLVRSSKNPRLTYKIFSVGSMNELGNSEYEVEIFTDGKPDEPRNLKHIEIEKMDSWGELVKQTPAE